MKTDKEKYEALMQTYMITDKRTGKRALFTTNKGIDYVWQSCPLIKGALYNYQVISVQEISEQTESEIYATWQEMKIQNHIIGG